MEQWRRVGLELEELLRPATFPVAVRLLEEGESPPQKIRMPLRDLGSPLALCQALTLTRTRGWTVAVGPEDSGCPVADLGLGWDEKIDPRWMVEFLLTMNYAKDQSTARRRIDGLSRIESGRVTGVVFSPLSRTRVEPQMVLMYGSPAQMMRMGHAFGRHTGQKVPGSYGGIAGSCNEGIVRTWVEDIPHLALPGNGDRVFAATGDEELIFAFPASWKDRLLEGLQATQQRGIRYPIPAQMEYELPFADLMTRFGGER